MLASSKVMDALKGIGLNLYERRLWVALLARGTSTAGELSEIANVPRSRTYDILQSLADKGFVVIQTSKPIKYVSVSPDKALGRVQKNLEEEIMAVQERISDLKDSKVMEELKELYDKGMKMVSPEELTGALKGKYSVDQQVNTMFKDASDSINIITNYEGLTELFSNHFDSLREAKDRGVDIKIACDCPKKSDDALKSLRGVAEIRNINKKELELGGKFFVVDNREMLVPLTDPKEVHSTQNMAIWTKSSHATANVLGPLFNMVWNRSKPVK